MTKAFHKLITKIFITTIIAAMIYTIPVYAKINGDIETMPVMSRAAFDEKLERIGKAINEKNHVIIDEIAEERGTYAASYDPRTLGKVSAIREQVGGSCWVYSALAMTEQNLIKKGYENHEVDLSELHAIYFYNKKHLGDTLTYALNKGGTEELIINDMADGIGPVYEADASFPKVDSFNDYDDIKIDDSLMYKHIYEPHKWDGDKLSSSAEGINNGKRLISEYGAFMLGMYYNSDYLKNAASYSSDMGYYFPTDVYYTNHAITIVGWDDNYPATNFTKTAPGNGAWLAKQSGGTTASTGWSWKGSGYMWISYYDGSIDGGVAACEFTKPGVTAKTITLSPLTQTLERGGATATISATVSPASAQDKTLLWSSSDESIATVSQTGVVTPVGKGTCDIIAKAKVGFAESKCSVTVTAPLKEIQLSVKEITVVKGEKFTLYNRGAKVNLIPSDTTDAITYLSSDPSVIEIVKDLGTEFIAKKAGKSVITIQSVDGKVSNSLVVNVAESGVTSIKRDGFSEVQTIELADIIGNEMQLLRFKLKAGELAEARQNTSASVDNKDVLFVSYGIDNKFDENGEILLEVEYYIRQFGEATITVRSDDELHQECKVKIIIKKKGSAPATQPSASPSQTPVTPSGNCSTGHSYVQETKKATASADGYSQKKCTRCGSVSDKRTIRKVNLISLSKTSVTYNGKKQYPKVKIYDSKNKDVTSKFSIRYSSNKNIGTASVTATCNNSDYNVALTAYFDIVPKGTTVKSAKKSGNAMTISWKKQGKADGYEISYSSKKSFAKSTAKTVKAKGSSTVKKTVKKLAKKTYYVKIRTYKTVGKKKYYSSWSKVVKAK